MSLRDGRCLRRVSTFACIGVINTGLYVMISWSLQTSGVMSAVFAGLTGYGAGALFSYFANRRLTFSSRAPHAPAMMKFAVVSMAGVSIGAGLPFLMTDLAGLRIEVPLLLAAAISPVMNYILLSRFVFSLSTERS